MSEKMYLLSICLPLATILLVFGMRYFSAVQQAKYRFANDEAYRQIAEKAVAAQVEVASALTSIDAALTEVKTQLTAVDKVLKQID